MPTVKLVDEHDPNPIVQRVFADIKATKKIDRVPTIWRALATPETVAGSPGQLANGAGP
jgi:hypothetical protein